MAESKKLLTKHNQTIFQQVKEDQFAKQVFSAAQNAKKRYAKVHRTEDAARDIKWIRVLSDTIPHIQKVIDNPRSFIKSVSYLVPAELAKKTGPESVIHLATHSQYVKDIEDDGSVIPSKILTSEAEMDIQIYENRFVFALIKRLHLYMEKRWIYLQHFAHLKDINVMYLDTEFNLGNANVKISTEITVSTPSEKDPNLKKTLDESLAEVAFLRKMVAYLVSSKFMKVDMKGARTFLPPIMMTNMLRSQPDYKACYKLWQFLNEEEHASMDFLVNEDIKNLTPDENKTIDTVNYLQVIDLLDMDTSSLRLTKKKYKAKVLKSIDDEFFLNDKFHPYMLVRADEQYYDDLMAPLKKKIDKKPKKIVDTLFKEEKKRIAEIEKQKKAAIALNKRLEKERIKREKEAERQRKLEQERFLKEQLALQNAREQALMEELKSLRSQVKQQALNDVKQDGKEVKEPLKIKKLSKKVLDSEIFVNPKEILINQLEKLDVNLTNQQLTDNILKTRGEDNPNDYKVEVVPYVKPSKVEEEVIETIPEIKLSEDHLIDNIIKTRGEDNPSDYKVEVPNFTKLTKLEEEELKIAKTSLKLTRKEIVALVLNQNDDERVTCKERVEFNKPTTISYSHKAFALVYENRFGLVRVCLRMYVKDVEEYQKIHSRFVKAKFPVGKDWFQFYLDDSFTSEEELVEIFHCASKYLAEAIIVKENN